MNQREWKAGDTKAYLTAASNVTMTSSNKWTAKYDFKSTYQGEAAKPEQIVPDGEYEIEKAGSSMTMLDISGVRRRTERTPSSGSATGPELGASDSPMTAGSARTRSFAPGPA